VSRGADRGAPRLFAVPGPVIRRWRGRRFGRPKVLPCTALYLGTPQDRKENGEKASLGNGRHRPGERHKVSETSTDVLTPLDVEIEFRIPRSSQKKGRAEGSFAPYFRVGRRVYYRRCGLEAWIAEQEWWSGGHRG
jgi:hypothetical protein